VTCEPPQPYLRCYHYRHPGLEVYLFFNEHPTQPIHASVHLKTGGPLGRYDALTNTFSAFASTDPGGETQLTLHLSPYETALLVSGAAVDPLLAALPPASAASPAGANELVLSGPWQIATATARQYPEFVAWGASEVLFDLTRPGTLPGFSGTFRYQTSFEAPAPAQLAQLDLGAAFEVAEVWVNGQTAGVRLAPPYQFEIGSFLQPGANRLTIEVTNTLVNAEPDFYSRYATQEPSGLLGPVRLRW